MLVQSKDDNLRGDHTTQPRNRAFVEAANALFFGNFHSTFERVFVLTSIQPLHVRFDIVDRVVPWRSFRAFSGLPKTLAVPAMAAEIIKLRVIGSGPP